MNKSIFILSFILIGIFMISFISAWDFDNTKSFSKTSEQRYGKIEITNAFGLGSKIATHELKKNTDICLTECHAYITSTLYNKQTLFNSLIAKDKDNKLKNINFKIYLVTYKDKQVSVNDYEEVCSLEEVFNNQTKSFLKQNVCSREIVGNHKEVIQEEQLELYDGRELPSGTYEWKVVGNKNAQDSIDWIANSNGVDLTEWAWWVGTSPINYWKFNETNGNANDSSGNGYNLTNNGGVTYNAGKLGNSASPIGGKYFGHTTLNYLINQSFTIALWVNLSNSVTNDRFILTYGDIGSGINKNYLSIKTANYGTGNISINLKASNGDDYYLGAVNNYADSAWHRIVVTRDNSTSINSLKLYIDGSLISQLSLDTSYSINPSGTPTNHLAIGANANGGENLAAGSVDDLQIYNVIWNTGDVGFDWNGGTGREGDVYIAPSISVSLNSPDDNVNIITPSIVFNSTLSSFHSIIKNATLYIWDASDTLLVKNTNSTIDPITNVSYWNISFGYDSNSFKWNVLGCNNYSNYSFASSNRTFAYGISIGDVNYTIKTLEGSVSVFTINISYVNQYYSAINANLIYNGTSYSSTKIGTSENILFSRSISLPLVDSQINNSFYWQIVLFNTTSTTYKNSSFYNQTIDNTAIDNCTQYTTRIINFTLYDEEERKNLNGTIETIVSIFNPIDYSNIVNFSTNISNLSNGITRLGVCLLNVSNYKMNYQARYYSNGYWTEYKYGQNITLTNNTIPQIINLYDLVNVSNNIEFKITFRNKNAIPVEGALIDLQRQYVPINQFISVETPITDKYGKTLAHFVTGSVVYNILVTKNGELLATFNNVVANCQSLPCLITLDAEQSITPLTNFNNYQGITYNFNVDKTNRRLSFIYSATDSANKDIYLLVKKMDNYGNNTICSINQTATSGTLVCDIPQVYGNVTIIAYPYVNGIQVDPFIFSLLRILGDELGNSRIILIMLLYCTLTFLFIDNPAVMIFGSILGLIFATMLGFISGGSSWVIITWFVIAGIILIIKINRRAN